MVRYEESDLIALIEQAEKRGEKMSDNNSNESKSRFEKDDIIMHAGLGLRAIVRAVLDSHQLRVEWETGPGSDDFNSGQPAIFSEESFVYCGSIRSLLS